MSYQDQKITSTCKSIIIDFQYLIDYGHFYSVTGYGYGSHDVSFYKSKGMINEKRISISMDENKHNLTISYFPIPNNYDGFVIFVSTYKDGGTYEDIAPHAVKVLKEFLDNLKVMGNGFNEFVRN